MRTGAALFVQAQVYLPSRVRYGGPTSFKHRVVAGKLTECFRCLEARRAFSFKPDAQGWRRENHAVWISGSSHRLSDIAHTPMEAVRGEAALVVVQARSANQHRSDAGPHTRRLAAAPLLEALI